MVEEILTHDEMCRKENTGLQKGINFNMGDRHSIILMSRATDATYHDEFQENNTVLIYDGHNATKSEGIDPKSVDQPERTPSGTLTQNGKFHQAAQQFKIGDRTAERVKVYEKMQSDRWIYHGIFLLTDSWIHNDGIRNVFKFKLNATDDTQFTVKEADKIKQRTMIPSNIMIEVLEKYDCKCAECGSENNLSFIHDGTNSISSDNVKIVCEKHNSEK